MTHFTESAIEQTALDWLKDLGYTIVFGGDIAPDEPAAERENYGEVILAGRLKDALERINPNHSPRSIGRCLSQGHASQLRLRWSATTAPFIKCWRMASKSNTARRWAHQGR